MEETLQERPSDPPRACDIVVLAASVGGLRAVGDILHQLPADFGAAVVVVQHLDPYHRSYLPELLARRTQLPVRQARGGDHLRPGAVWIAPPDHHLLVDADGELKLSQGVQVHHLRPAADPLLESVAAHSTGRVTAVILTGSGRDGAAGVRAIKAAGGTVIAQNEETSENWGMPGAAVATGCVDRILPLSQIGPALVALWDSRAGHEQ